MLSIPKTIPRLKTYCKDQNSVQQLYSSLSILEGKHKGEVQGGRGTGSPVFKALREAGFILAHSLRVQWWERHGGKSRS